MSVEKLPTSPDPSATGRWAVPISDVVLPPAAVAAVVETLESGWLSTGPRIERFEAAMVDFLGGGEAVACSSGTAALHLALAALGIGPGDEVIVPSMSFVATANAVRYVGAEPIFADIASLEDPTLAPASVRAALTPQTAALIVMHYAGYPVDDELFDIAGQAGIPVVEDAGARAACWARPGASASTPTRTCRLARAGWSSRATPIWPHVCDLFAHMQ
jgi:dTDP-4-amino-4,6-dideoxygalactose transaminase